MKYEIRSKINWQKAVSQRQSHQILIIGLLVSSNRYYFAECSVNVYGNNFETLMKFKLNFFRNFGFLEIITGNVLPLAGKGGRPAEELPEAERCPAGGSRHPALLPQGADTAPSSRRCHSLR
jgi:hypothetical protein